MGSATGGLDVYTTEEVDAALADKADAADVYTKSEVDAAVGAVPIVLSGRQTGFQGDPGLTAGDLLTTLVLVPAD